MTIGIIMTKKTTAKKAASVPAPVDPTVITFTRAQLRDGLLGNVPKAKTRIIQLFDMPIELHQPTLRSILDNQAIEDTKQRGTKMIIEYSYVPGTNERIFDDADREMIHNWPFTGELVDLQMAIADLTGVDTADAEELLIADPLDVPS